MSLSEEPRTSRVLRAFYSVPVIGWIARDLLEGDADVIYYLLAALLSLWVIAVMTWGLPALTLPALFMVPVIVVCLLLITVGR